MEKLSKRDRILYVRIRKENFGWIEQQMKALGYTKTRGKSEFVDQLLTENRQKKTK